MRWLVAALFIVPIVEIALFVVIGQRIGLLWTLATVIFTAGLGSVLFSIHGRGLQAKLHRELQTSGFPAESLFKGLCLGVAALFLMTPGFFTDFLGFMLFVPPLQKALFHFLSKRLRMTGMAGGGTGFRATWHQSAFRGGPIIDGEAEPLAEPSPTQPGTKGLSGSSSTTHDKSN